MIQRIQSLYLLMTFLLAVLFQTGTIIRLEGDGGLSGSLTINGASYMTGSGEPGNGTQWDFALTASLMAVPAAALASLLLFRKRNLQALFVKILLLLILVSASAAVVFALKASGSTGMKIVPGWKMLLPVICFVLSVLALKGIRNDEELVKSYDRIR